MLDAVAHQLRLENSERTWHQCGIPPKTTLATSTTINATHLESFTTHFHAYLQSYNVEKLLVNLHLRFAAGILDVAFPSENGSQALVRALLAFKTHPLAC